MQRHGDRLGPLDAAFLHVETATRHMHVGALLLCDPPAAPEAFSVERVRRLVASRLHLFPRFRQRLAFPPGGVGNPVWIDDVAFDLTRHVRRAAVSSPGTTEALHDLANRIFSQPLDRRRPLWEFHVVDGLADGRVAVVAKTHHAMVDGVSGMEVGGLLFDPGPDSSTTLPAPQPWEPQPAPSEQELVAAGLDELVRQPLEGLGRRLQSTSPGEVVGRAAELGQGAVSFLRQGLAGRVSRTLINQEPGARRRLAVEQVDLDDLRHLKGVFETTLNDVLLAAVGDTIGRYLRHRGASTRGRSLRAVIPVSTRAVDEGDDLGNRVANVFVDLPIDEMDPVERLRRCSQQMDRAKSEHAADAADTFLGLTRFAPPALQAVGARLAFGGHLYNVIVTNVPGPQMPLYCLGARVVGAYPLVPLAAGQSLAVGAVSLDGRVNIGFTADHDALPDADVLGGMLLQSLEELRRSAEAEAERKARSHRHPDSEAAP